MVLPSAGTLIFHTAVLLVALVLRWLSFNIFQSGGMGSLYRDGDRVFFGVLQHDLVGAFE